MDRQTQIILIILFVVGVAICLFFMIKNNKKSETFNMTDSSNNLLLTDSNGNLSTYTTKNSSILLTDDSGKLTSLPFPKGLIMIWYNSGSTNPTNADLSPGWSICDGSNGTPDLRGRFVLGCGQGTGLTNRVINETPGGEENHTLTTTEMPSHDHYPNGNSTCSGTDCPVGAAVVGYFNDYNTQYPSTATGGGGPHNNMPPYYVLCYICYTGVGL